MNNGVDLSHHNGPVNMGALRRAGYDFVLCKATQGATFVDPLWKRNRDAARAAGLYWGPYLFVNQHDPARVQADRFLSTVGAPMYDDLPVFLDLEGDWKGSPHPGQVATAIIAELEAAGWRTGWYSYPAFITAWRLDRYPVLRDRPYWAADYNPGFRGKPRIGTLPGWVIHQFTSAGRVPGVGVKLDLNDLADLDGDGDVDVWDLCRLAHVPLLTVAQRWIGTLENPPGTNRQPFAVLAGHPNGGKWCATAVVAWARLAGIKLPSESAYTPTMKNGFAKAGTFRAASEPALPGWVVFFDWPDNIDRIQHVGVVAADQGDQLVTIEGNTSSGNTGSQDNGGGVFRRVRSKSLVAGYGIPAPARKNAPKPKVEEDAVGIVVRDPATGELIEVTEWKGRRIGTIPEAEEILRNGGGPQTDATGALLSRRVS